MLVRLMLEQILPASVIPGTGAEDGRCARWRGGSPATGRSLGCTTRATPHRQQTRREDVPASAALPKHCRIGGVSTNATSASVVTDARPAVPIAETVTPTPIFDDGI